MSDESAKPDSMVGVRLLRIFNALASTFGGRLCPCRGSECWLHLGAEGPGPVGPTTCGHRSSGGMFIWREGTAPRGAVRGNPITPVNRGSCARKDSPSITRSTQPIGPDTRIRRPPKPRCGKADEMARVVGGSVRNDMPASATCRIVTEATRLA